jgi:hypothetical protein
VFPVGAGLASDPEAFPSWWGPLDVGVAAVLAILTLALHALTQGKVTRQAEEASYNAYRIVAHGILALTAVFLFFGDHVHWTNCLPGFAWRTWLLLYSLPAWFTASGLTTRHSQPQGRPEAP